MYDVWNIRLKGGGNLRAYPSDRSAGGSLSTSLPHKEQAIATLLNMICDNEGCRIISVIFDPDKRDDLLVITEKVVSQEDERLGAAQRLADRNRGGRRPISTGAIG